MDLEAREIEELVNEFCRVIDTKDYIIEYGTSHDRGQKNINQGSFTLKVSDILFDFSHEYSSLGVFYKQNNIIHLDEPVYEQIQYCYLNINQKSKIRKSLKSTYPGYDDVLGEVKSLLREGRLGKLLDKDGSQ